MALQDGVSESEDVKKKALLRLAVAGLITATALAGLWWLDQDKSRKPTPAPSPALPAPITPAPALDAAPPRPEAEPAETPTGDQAALGEQPAQADAATSQPAAQPPAELPPPPRVSNQAGQPSRRPPPPSALPLASAPPPAMTPAARPPQAAPLPPGVGYVVQLGVFSNPDNARELVEQLGKRGIRAHMETRVQIGPFLNRGEAEKAQTEMRRLGYTPLVTPASATR